MKRDEFLPDLKGAFREWRAGKSYKNEAIPEDLLADAKAAGAKYGSKRVARALGLDPKKLVVKGEEADAALKRAADRAMAREMPTETPSFSRIQVSFPRGPQSAPLMEAETPVGVKLRVFAMTPETIGVLSSFCRGGVP